MLQILHLTRKVSRAIDRSVHSLIVEAPADLTADLGASGTTDVGDAADREFRRRYYRVLSPLLQLESTPWGATLDTKVAQVMAATALGAVSHTCKTARVILAIASRGMDQSACISVVTDNSAGVKLWHELRGPITLLGLPPPQLGELASPGSLGARARRFMDVRIPQWRETSHRFQDLHGHLHERIAPPHGSAHFSQRRLGGSSRSVVLFSDSPRTWRLLLPIYAALSAKGVRVVALTTRQPTAEHMREVGVIPSLAQPRRLPRRFVAGVRKELRRMPLPPNALGELAPEVERVSLKLADALREILVGQVTAWLARVIGVADATERLLDRAKSACVAHANEWPMGHALTATARRGGGAAALLTHGLLDYRSPELAYYPPVEAFVVWGELMVKGLAESQLDPRIPVIALGHPHLEQMLIHTPVASRQDGPPSVLVLFGRPSRFLLRSRFERCVNEVLEVADQLPGVDFVIKPHPADTSGFWPALLAAREFANVRLVTTDFYQLLRGASAVVTMHSTAGAEAMCADVPVVSIDLRDPQDDAVRDPDFVTFGAAYVANSRGSLRAPLEHALASGPQSDRLAERRRSFATAFLSRTSEPAADRIAAHLMELAVTGAADRYR